jgi:hypothetical protein
MEGKVHIGNKWWKILTIYSKEMKTTRRRVENAMQEKSQDCILLGGEGVLNGNKQGDQEGEWTYIGSRGETMIDYGIVNEEEEFRIGERAESDHLEVALRKRRGWKEQTRKGVGHRNKTIYFLFFLELLFYEYV